MVMARGRGPPLIHTTLPGRRVGGKAPGPFLASTSQVDSSAKPGTGLFFVNVGRQTPAHAEKLSECK